MMAILRKRLTRSRLARFLRQPLFSQCWLWPVWCLLGLSKAAIFLVSFRRLAPWLGGSVGTAAWLPLLDERQARRARQVGHVVQLAARYTPWSSNCFPQAVTAQLLLRWYRIPYVMCFGVRREVATQAFKAHAWVTVGHVAVTGGAGFEHYHVVGCYMSPMLMHGCDKA